MDALGRYLDRAAATPFAWGMSDCATIAADWLVACGYPDPLGPLRGSWADALGFERLVATHGGLLAMAERAAGRLMLPRRAGEIARGDVGVIHGRLVDAACAIHAGGGLWAWKCDRGLAVIRAKPIAAWGVA